MGYWKSEKYDYRTQTQKDLEDQIKLLKGQLGASTEKHKVDPDSLVWGVFRVFKILPADADTPERKVTTKGCPSNFTHNVVYRVSPENLANHEYWQPPNQVDFERNKISMEDR